MQIVAGGRQTAHSEVLFLLALCACFRGTIRVLSRFAAAPATRARGWQLQTRFPYGYWVSETVRGFGHAPRFLVEGTIETSAGPLALVPFTAVLSG